MADNSGTLQDPKFREKWIKTATQMTQAQPKRNNNMVMNMATLSERGLAGSGQELVTERKKIKVYCALGNKVEREKTRTKMGM